MRDFDRNFVPEYLARFLDDPSPYMIMKNFSPFSLTQLGIIWAKFNQVTSDYSNLVDCQNFSPYFQNTLIVGDTHGDFISTLRITKPFFEEKVDSLIFMGDYIDRGEFSFLNIMFLIGMVLAWPDRVILLRGNHEDLDLNNFFGYEEEIQNYFPDPDVSETVMAIMDSLYNLMSLVAITPQKSVCMHAGIPKGNFDLSLVDLIPKPHVSYRLTQDKILKTKLKNVLTQIRWNDPTEEYLEDQNKRSYHGYFYYTSEEVDEFLSKHNLNRIYRSHEDPRGGYQEIFPNQLYQVFSNEPYFGGIPKAYVIHETPTHIYLRDLDFNIQKQLV